MIDDDNLDNGMHDPDEEDVEAGDESLKFDDFVRVCPACKQPITKEMDSCPFCGDIIFRSLTDGTFSPRRGPLVKFFTLLIIILVILAVLGMLLTALPW